MADLLALDLRLMEARTIEDLESLYLQRDPAGVAAKFLLVSDGFVTKHTVRKFDPEPPAQKIDPKLRGGLQAADPHGVRAGFPARKTPRSKSKKMGTPEA